MDKKKSMVDMTGALYFESAGEGDINQMEYDLDANNWKNQTNATSQEPFEPIPEKNLALAMGFVPKQRWQDVYETDVALSRGTIFPALDKMFIGEGGSNCD